MSYLANYPCPGCRTILDERDETSCWRCGAVLGPSKPKPIDDVVANRFPHAGYEIEWKDYTPGKNYELRGEWCAMSDNGVAAIHMPAIVTTAADEHAKIAEKLKTLRKLLELLDGSN